MAHASLLKLEAKRLGKTRYFTGIACKHGHIAERRTTNSQCVECRDTTHYDSVKRHRATPAGRLRLIFLGSKQRAKRGAYIPLDPATILPYPDPAVCELCGAHPKIRRLAADHCHATGNFRGWLCARCNTMLGNMEQIGQDKIKDYLNDVHDVK